MAKVLCIGSETAITGVCSVGDIVGVFDDDHVFSAAEGPPSFSVYRIAGYTGAELWKVLASLLPPGREDNPEAYTEPVYWFRVKNPAGATLLDIVGSNITLK